MTVLYPQIRSPMNQHTPWLIAALEQLGSQITTLPWGRHRENEPLWEKVSGRWQDILRIRRALKAVTFDMLVVKTSHDWATLSRDVPLLLLTRRLCPATVVQLHGSLSDLLVAPGHTLFKIASKWLVRLSDAVLVLSSEEQEHWLRFAPAGRCYVTTNPFAATPHAASLERTPTAGNPGQPPVLLYVGRLLESKGLFDLLDAMPQVTSNARCRLAIVGDGAHALKVRQRAQERGLTEYVTFTGYLTGNALAQAYQQADIFVLPSWSEGFPTVIAEAMDAGLPIVTTHIRGAADRLREGVHALFVPPRNPAALAKALIRLLENPTLRARMGQANREEIAAFAPDKVGRSYLEILERVLRERAGGK
jgi:glycosyltransferase involved in cell wall biosynthesis